MVVSETTSAAATVAFFSEHITFTHFYFTFSLTSFLIQVSGALKLTRDHATLGFFDKIAGRYGIFFCVASFIVDVIFC
jgi:hypothetical protein